MSEIKDYYDSNAEVEWHRLSRHKVEFDITKRCMKKFIRSTSSILDVGGGPGRYSIFLAKQGHEVTLLDLSLKSIELAERKAVENKVKLKEYIHADARKITEKVTGMFDVVLCMGPLYHLLKECDRIKVVNECMQRLKKGGLIFATFISAYAPIIDYLKKYPEKIVGMKERLLKYLDDGRNIIDQENPGFTTAYFINPKDIEEFMNRFALEKKVLTGVEGLLAQSESKVNSLDEEAYEEWLDLIYKTSTNPMTWAACEHFLYIGKKI